MSAAIEPFTLTGADGTAVAAWRARPAAPMKAIVQIAHGMAEHFGRYHRLTRRLTDAGYGVYGADHRGHGATARAGTHGDFGPGGFQALVDDMAALTAAARRETPGRPLILLGHSMGSFAAQIYLLQHPADLDGLVLSGTAALDAMVEAMAGAPPGMESLNAPFEPGRTPFDWLSRDTAEVDAYIADPLCGFAVTEASRSSMIALAMGARGDARLAAARRDLPILVISGQFDPVTGPAQAFAKSLIDGWRSAGLTHIDHRIYPGGRHEMFNELNRVEVEADLIAWLDAVVSNSGG
ncbi:MAG: lysophospholipase [Caulobacteraceae bacterium]